MSALAKTQEGEWEEFHLLESVKGFQKISSKLKTKANRKKAMLKDRFRLLKLLLANENMFGKQAKDPP